jgi:hypothetical protein
MLAINLLPAADASAACGNLSATRRGITRTMCNQAELNAFNWCYDAYPGAKGAKGAIWMTASSGEQYNQTITVSDTATSVPVYIRGSIYTCYTPQASADIYAVNVSPGNPNKSRLTIQGTSLYRGRGVNQAHAWVRPGVGSYLKGSLDVSGLVPAGTSATIDVGIYRCFQIGGVKGDCSTETVPVTITRKPVPAPTWQVALQTRMDVGSTNGTYFNGNETKNVAAGTVAKWYHRAVVSAADIPSNFVFGNLRTGNWPGVGATGSTGITQTETWPNSSKPVKKGTYYYKRDPKDPKSGQYQLSYTAQADDAQKTFCDRLYTTQGVQAGAGRNTTFPYNNSGAHCIYVPYSYEPPPPGDSSNNKSLNPGATVRSNSVAPDDQVIFDYVIKHNGGQGTTISKTTNYWPVIFVVPVGASAPNQTVSVKVGLGATRTCSNFYTYFNGRGYSNCTAGTSGTVGAIMPGASASAGSFTANLGQGTWANVRPGDKICSYLTIDPWAVKNDVNDPSDRMSNVVCATVGKEPQLQLRGADSWSDKGFRGTASLNARRGSWSQYGLLADHGAVDSFGASGWTANSASGTQKNFAKLIFANNQTVLGKFDSGHVVNWPPVPSDTSPTPLASPVPNFNSFVGDKPVIYNGNLQIGATTDITLPKSSHITLIVRGDVTINRNISYPTGTTLAEIPSLVIVAIKNSAGAGGNIFVSPSVKQLAGVYVASGGRFASCGSGQPAPADLKINGTCSNGLTVNGALIANALRFQRTAGGGAAAETTTPAEMVNYQPNLFLTPFIGANENGVWTTDRVTELPPRY